MKSSNVIIADMRSRVSLEEAFNIAGFEVNRKGFCVCPFHNERTPSMKIYSNNTYYCFGCGASGDVIDFYKTYYNLTTKDAVEQIDKDFNLGITNKEPEFNDYLRRWRIEKARQAELKKIDDINRIYWELFDEWKHLKEVMEKRKETDEFFYALQNIGKVEDALDYYGGERRKYC